MQTRARTRRSIGIAPLLLVAGLLVSAAAASATHLRTQSAGGASARWSSQAHHSVYLFDAASGMLKGRVGDFEHVIHHLVLSRDGRFLAATLGGGDGVRVIDTERMREIAADRDYGKSSFGA